MRYRRDDGEFVDVALESIRAQDLRAARPVREFRSFRGQRHYSGWYWSATVGHHVVYESRLELARLLLADYDLHVDGVVGQPMLLLGRDGRRFRRHVPDFLLFGTDASVVVVDVKPLDRLRDPKVVAQFAWTRRVCESVGWGFEVWSGAEPVLLANVRFLSGYRRSALVDPEVCAVVKGLLHGGESLEEIEHALGEAPARSRGQGPHQRRTRAAVLHLLWRGELVTDLSSPLSRSAVLWPAGHDVRSCG